MDYACRTAAKARGASVAGGRLVSERGSWAGRHIDHASYLLHDLFEANTYWELATEVVTSEQISAGWRVTLEATARKVVVDAAGAEKEVPMDDVVEVGVLMGPRDGSPGQPLYLRSHRTHSGRNRISITVPNKPDRAGIDPRHLLIDDQPGDNIREAKVVLTAISRLP